MAWEHRKHGVYYYRSRRIGGTVVHEYRGNGPAAVLEAEADEQEQAERTAQREALAAHQARLHSLSATLDEHLALAREVAARVLVAAGFHQHRGQWRRKR